MKASLIFDSVNDLIFSKWDEAFIKSIKSSNEQNNDNISDSSYVSQLLSPIITSQRVMGAQFGNTYFSMQLKDNNTSLVFDEWLDHVLLIISEEKIDDAHRELLDCKTFVQHICGQNINLLHSPIYQDWLSVLLESRSKGDSIPGASGMILESSARATALNALKTVSKEIKVSPHQHYHLILYVGDKMLALYSSRGSEDLSSPDLILMSIQCIAAQEYWKNIPEEHSKDDIVRLPWLSEENSAIINICAGAANSPCAPYSMHIAEVAPRITFVILVDMDLREVGIAAHISIHLLSNLRRLLLQRNLEMLPSTLDSLESALKKTTDALRKNKSNSNLCARLTSRMLELRKACVTTTPLTPETAATATHTALDSVLEQLKPDIPSIRIARPLQELRTILAPCLDFLRAKAKRYFMESGWKDADLNCSTPLHSYAEEFPGLIHFVYVDRTAGRSIAPDMADCVDMLSPETVRAIVSRAFFVVHEGYCAATWRCGALHVCSILWWERRQTGVRPAKPPHPAAVRALHPPGDILSTFYRQLLEQAFPNESQGVGIKELICVHLGLVPASTAVQQARRLAHVVQELTGVNPTLAADLL